MYLSSGTGQLCFDCCVALNFSSWHDLLWGLAPFNQLQRSQQQAVYHCWKESWHDLFHPFPSITGLWCCFLSRKIEKNHWPHKINVNKYWCLSYWDVVCMQFILFGGDVSLVKKTNIVFTSAPFTYVCNPKTNATSSQMLSRDCQKTICWEADKAG